MRLTFGLLLAGCVLAGCTSSDSSTATAPAPAPAAPTAAAPQGQSCVELTRIREAKVIDDRTIDFYLRDGQVLRNQLPNQCPQLGFEKAFSYSTSLTKLCSTDIITVIQTGGGPRTGASCGLGSFVPHTPAQASATPPQ